MKREIFAIVPVICILVLTSCVSNPAYINKYAIDIKKSKIAVLPFRDYNTNDGNNSGELVRSIFEQKLMLKGFTVIEIEKTSSSVDYSVLKKNEFPGNWIVETGSKIGADYMIYGSLHDYRVYQNLTSFLYIFSWLEVTSSVGVTARMVSCATGEVVWSGSFSKSSYTFNDAASESVYALIRTIKRNPAKPE
jgi:TolB-like protein